MGRRLLPAATAGAVVALALGWLLPGGGPASAAPSTRHVDHLTLVKQSPWVGPNAPDQDLTMSLRIRSSAPRDGLKLSFTVYHPLSTRSAFDETLIGKGLGSVIAQSPGIALSGFSTDVQGVTDVTIPVDGDTTPTGTGNWTADLGCQPGSCANVYPVKVTLSDPSGSGAQLVSYLVYDDPSSTSEPLRLAVVVPLGLGPPTADTSGRVPAPSPAGLSNFEGLLGAVAGSPDVAVTLAPDAATLDQLAVTGHGHTVAEVAGLSTSSTRQTLAGPFVPVDAGGLVGAGLGGELNAQLRRGDAVLGSAPIGVHATKGTWVARTGLDQDAVDQLGGEDSHLVVPPGSVSGPTGPLTVTQPFTLTPAPGSTVTAPSTGTPPTAMVSDAGLDERLDGAQGPDAALAAVQLLAEASLIYYEVPNLRGPGGIPAVRGVVAVPPAAWAPSAPFVSSLLSGLAGNPVIEAVTVDQLFAEVPVGADNEATVRHVVTPTAGGVQPRTARDIRAARARQSGFASAVAGSAAGAGTAQVTDDLLLAAESSLLSGRQQQAGLAGFNTAIDQRLRGLGVRSDTIRLTAGTASVPITLLRNTGYPVTVVVKLTSDKLRFPMATTQLPGAICKAPHVQSSAGRSSFSALCTLDHATNAVYVNMSARASGDFQIRVALESPEGNLVLAGGQLTVRSLSTSAVAIALSVGAVLVLFFWWGRTLWRGKRRRGAHTVARVRGTVA